MTEFPLNTAIALLLTCMWSYRISVVHIPQLGTYRCHLFLVRRGLRRRLPRQCPKPCASSRFGAQKTRSNRALRPSNCGTRGGSAHFHRKILPKVCATSALQRATFSLSIAHTTRSQVSPANRRTLSLFSRPPCRHEVRS